MPFSSDLVAPDSVFEKKLEGIGGSVAFTASGHLLFALRNQIVETNIATRRRERTLTAGNSPIACFAVASASNLLAALANDGTVFLWDTATGRRLHAFKLQDGNTESREEYAIVLSPNGKYLAVCGSGVVRVCDLSTRRILKAFHFLYAAAFSPDGKTLYLGGARRLQAWDVPTWQPRQIRTLGDLMTHPTFTAIDCSPDGKWIVGGLNISRPDYFILAASETKTLKEVWDKNIGSWETTNGASKIVYSPSGKQIAVVIQENGSPALNYLSLRNAKNGGDAVYYEMSETIRSIAFSRNGKYLAALTDRVTVWSATPQREISKD